MLMGREVKRVTYSAWSRAEGEGEDNWSLCCFDLSLLFRVRELSSLTHSSASLCRKLWSFPLPSPRLSPLSLEHRECPSAATQCVIKLSRNLSGRWLKNCAQGARRCILVLSALHVSMLCYRRYVSLHPLFAHSRPARPCVALNLARVKRKHCPGLIRARGETIKNRLKLGKQKNINLNRLLACSKLFSFFLMQSNPCSCWQVKRAEADEINISLGAHMRASIALIFIERSLGNGAWCVGCGRVARRTSQAKGNLRTMTAGPGH